MSNPTAESNHSLDSLSDNESDISERALNAVIQPIPEPLAETLLPTQDAPTRLPNSLIATLQPSPRSTVNELHDFALKIVPLGSTFLFRAHRRPDRIIEFYLEGSFRFNRTLVMVAKRSNRQAMGTSTYTLFLDKNQTHSIGSLSSNFLGTHFVLKHDGLQDHKPGSGELVAIQYQPNVLGYLGPRKMTVLMPFIDANGARNTHDQGTTLLDLHKVHAANEPKVLVLNNKEPQWNDETESFVLNFFGRVTIASVKNFQICSDKDIDYICMQFGRVSNDSFTMDVRYPFCPLQAIGVALSSIDSKIACE